MADVPISSLPAATSLGGTDLLPVVQGGVTKRVNVAQLPTSGVTSINTRSGAVTVTATDVGLGNVSNTSDTAKPLSTAALNALAGKADYPAGGANGQALIKSGTGTAWAAIGGGGSTSSTTVDLATFAGADPTGTTDSTAAISNAIAAVPAGGTLRVDGSYLATGITISSRSDITISGGGTITGTSTTAAVLRLANCTNITVTGVRLRQTATTRNAAGYGIQADSCTRVLILGVKVEGTAAAGIIFFGGTTVKVVACTVTGTLADGIHFSGSATDCVAAGNAVVNPGDDGIAVVSYQYNTTPVSQVEITGNTIRGYLNSGGRGISVVGGKDVAVTGNGISAVAYAGIYIAQENTVGAETLGVTNIAVTGNRVTDANANTDTPYSAVLIIGGSATYPISNVLIEGNIVTTPRRRGIDVFSQGAGRIAHLSIRNNQVTGNGNGDGILVDAVGLQVDVTGNRVTLAKDNGIYVAPTCAAANIDGNTVIAPNQGSSAGKLGIYGGPTVGSGTGGLVIPDATKAGITKTVLAWPVNVSTSGGGVADTFTGVDGAALSATKWAVTRGNEGTATPGSAAILTNQARLIVAQNPNAYVHVEAAAMAAQADTDVKVDFTVATQQTTFVFLSMNSLTAELSASNGGNTVAGYIARVDVTSTAAAGGISIVQDVNNLTPVTVRTITAGTTYTVRFKRSGLTLQAKVWDRTATEPAGWDASVTLTSRPQQLGEIGFGVGTSSAPTSTKTVDFKNLLAV